jgi:hypothetical protein
MPLVNTAFEKVAIDLIGPIHPISQQGNRYILTVVDFATRYPEAVPLPTIETERVAEALVSIFGRVWIPKEVLSDMGSQFVSGMMKEVSRLLSFKQVTTTPYHPIANGLCEKFNGTLKQMLRRLCAEKPSDWDRYIPALLFAYREVPQASTGFSPFELLYGKSVRGPLTILKELWTKEVDLYEVKTAYQYVIDLRQRIEDTCKMAHEMLSKARVKYKHYYDRKARDRQFKVGDSVLILLPTDHNKLLLQWRGPYKVTGVLPQHDYKLEVKGKIKIFHANLLRQYIVRETSTPTHSGAVLDLASVAIIEDEDDSGCVFDNEQLADMFNTQVGKETYKDVLISPDLSNEQREQLKRFLAEYQDVLTDIPGMTNLVEHSIELTLSEPVRSKPYPLPHTMREVVRDEIDSMLKMGVIAKIYSTRN